MSNKEEKFKEIASRRVNNILKNIDSLEKCSNIYNYEYSRKDVDTIFKRIEDKIRLSKASFQIGLDKKSDKFKL